MAEHNELGKLGEELGGVSAKNGYIILATNWTEGRGGYYCPKEAILAVIEVKRDHH
jgi:hypothetical protein